MKGIIYKYTNKVNGKVYIGQTVREKRRQYDHRKTYNSWRSYFHEAIKKYGFNSFEYEILESIEDEDLNLLKQALNTKEQYYIAKYNSNNPTYGYNLTAGGGGTLGCVQSKESNLKRSATMKSKGKTLSPDQVAYLQSFRRKVYVLAHHSPIEKYTLDGELVCRFETLKEAAASVNGNSKALSKALNRVSKPGVFKGYYWKLI